MGSEFVRVCRACAGANTNDGRDPNARAPRSAARRDVLCLCGEEVPFHQARPVVSASGLMEMCCPACADASPDERYARQSAVAAADTVEQEVIAVAPPARAGWMRYTAAAASVAALLVVSSYIRDDKPAVAGGHGSGAVRNSDNSDDGTAAPVPNAGPARWELDPSPTVEDTLEDDGEPLYFEYPTLADWVHPVPGVENKVPINSSRRFGAERPAVFRTECGKGHCGVDLMGPRGQPIVAVAWGVVVRVEHNSNRRSGKYVRIEHPDYVYTSYMHLDDIPAGIEVGREVNAGDVVGTLGRSGIKRSAPHLHFSLEIPDDDRTRYLDPAPYLANATVLDMFRYHGRRSVARDDSNHGDDHTGVSTDDDDADPADLEQEQQFADEPDDAADSGQDEAAIAPASPAGAVDAPGAAPGADQSGR